MIKAVVFDLDGTLLNTIQDLANAANHALRTLGLPEHTTEEFLHFVGDGAADAARGPARRRGDGGAGQRPF